MGGNTSDIKKSKTRPGVKVLSSIGLLIILIYSVLQILDEDSVGIMVSVIAVVLACGVGIAAITISRHFKGTDVYGKAYLALSIGYFSYALAEIIYYSLGFLGYETYPSIADVFFFLVYPFIFIHIFLSLKFFLKKLSIFQKIQIPLIPITCVVIYVTLSIEELQEDSFDFWYGIIFVSSSSITLSLSVLGAATFRQGRFEVIWLLLMIGLFLNTIGDVWYYHLEIFGLYHDAHVVTLIWYLSNMIMIYALFKHRF